MKKLAVLSATLFLSTVLFAQWEVEPRIGVNFSKVSGQFANDGDSQHKWITGMVAGGFATFNINEMFSVSGEFLFINSGGKTTSFEEGSQANENNSYYMEKFNDLEIPVLFRYTFGEAVQFYAEIGPYFAYKLGGNYKVLYLGDEEREGKLKFVDYPDDNNSTDYYLNYDLFRRFDFGAYYGIGVQKKLGPGKLSFDFRFGHGFLDTNKWNGVDYEGNEYEKPEGYKPFKNRNLSLSFGYIIPLGNS